MLINSIETKSLKKQKSEMKTETVLKALIAIVLSALLRGVNPGTA